MATAHDEKARPPIYVAIYPPPTPKNGPESHLDFNHHLALTKKTLMKKNGEPMMEYRTFPAAQSQTLKCQPDYPPPKPTRDDKQPNVTGTGHREIVALA